MSWKDFKSLVVFYLFAGFVLFNIVSWTVTHNPVLDEIVRRIKSDTTNMVIQSDIAGFDSSFFISIDHTPFDLSVIQNDTASYLPVFPQSLAGKQLTGVTISSYSNTGTINYTVRVLDENNTNIYSIGGSYSGTTRVQSITFLTPHTISENERMLVHTTTTTGILKGLSFTFDISKV